MLFLIFSSTQLDLEHSIKVGKKSFINIYDNMFACLKKLWKTLTTGWVLEYPNNNNGPSDFFDKRDRVPQWTPPDQEDGLERCSYSGEGRE